MLPLLRGLNLHCAAAVRRLVTSRAPAAVRGESRPRAGRRSAAPGERADEVALEPLAQRAIAGIADEGVADALLAVAGDIH